MRRRVISGDVFVGKNASRRGNSLLHTGIIQRSRTRDLKGTRSVFSYDVSAFNKSANKIDSLHIQCILGARGGAVG